MKIRILVHELNMQNQINENRKHEKRSSVDIVSDINANRNEGRAVFSTNYEYDYVLSFK